MSVSRLLALMTVENYLATTGERSELVEGIVRAMAPSSPRHGLIAAQAARLLGNHLDAYPQCRVLIEPGVQPRVRADINVRIPDLGVTCTPLSPDDKLLRGPLVLIEILSPSNPKDTWANVWAYTTIPSVAEILVLHTTAIGADLLRRDDGGDWPANPLTLGEGDELTLESIGMHVPLAAFYRTA
jgi:Uma2 family endonuclease